jgi:transcriptional regulator GlxA family with amidase domain
MRSVADECEMKLDTQQQRVFFSFSQSRSAGGLWEPFSWQRFSSLVTATNARQHVVRAVSHIKHHFVESIRIDKLAEAANMSPTTFRQHFREITGMSPVQFQKLLRLQEARQLMLNQNVSAGSVCSLVGYESASQFTREYRRLSGAPPQRDIRMMLSR